MTARRWRAIERLGQAALRPLADLLDELDFLAVVLMSAGALPRGEGSFLIRHTGVFQLHLSPARLSR